MPRVTYVASLPATYSWPQIVQTTRQIIPPPIVDINLRELSSGPVVSVLVDNALANATIDAWQTQIAAHVPAPEPDPVAVDPATLAADIRIVAETIADPTSANTLTVLRGAVNATKSDIAVALDKLATAVEALAEQ